MVFEFKPKPFITFWFVLSNLIVLWDATYVLSRPHSMPGGKWHALWKPYALYAEIDYVYGFPAYEEKDGFPSAQAFMTLVEAFFNWIYVYTSYFSTNQSTRITGALIGFASATSCFSKTTLYMLCEYFSGFKYVGHNPWHRLVFLYIIPSAPWIFVSLYSLLTIGGQLKRGLLQVPDKKASVAKKTK
ncbi:hypothetical protein V1514DRAFT_336144 [Lipomyces japonicus]|uniref:uncharacterized protein n=1 Tax=Lipomyces japonicus TaxID=56871 RepID=UPI0034D00577